MSEPAHGLRTRIERISPGLEIQSLRTNDEGLENDALRRHGGEGGPMPERFEYFLDLADFEQCSSSTTLPDLQLREAQPTDTQVLAELMLDAYRGTIDYDDETLDDAVGEVQAYLAGERGGQPLLRVSRLAFEGSVLVSACLAGDWHERQGPAIAYVMARAEWKNLGVGQQVLCEVLRALGEEGHRKVRAVITEGNTPSERLFGRLGFQRVSIT